MSSWIFDSRVIFGNIQNNNLQLCEILYFISKLLSTSELCEVYGFQNNVILFNIYNFDFANQNISVETFPNS